MSQIQNGNITKMSRKTPITSKNHLYLLLDNWLLNNQNVEDSKTIGDSNIGVTPLIWVKIENELFHINSDSKMYGVKEFLSNSENEWHTILNSIGKKNKITNRMDRMSISGFYMYKILE